MAVSAPSLPAPLSLVGSSSGTALEPHRALGNLLPGWVALPARGKGSQGASWGSLTSPEEGLCSWLVCTVQNTAQGCALPPRQPAAKITASGGCWERGQPP